MRVQGIVSPKHANTRELELAIDAAKRLAKLVIAFVLVVCTAPIWVPVGFCALIVYCVFLGVCGAADEIRMRVTHMVGTVWNTIRRIVSA